LGKALGDNALLQGQLNQAFVSRLLELVTKAREVRTVATERQAEKQSSVYVGDHLALTRVLDRFLMYVDTRDLSVAPHFLVGDGWEPGITWLFTSLLQPGMTFVDIGANFGYFTLLAATAVGPQGRVYSFEAGPRNFEILTLNVGVNWLGDRVRAHHCAVLDAKRQISFYEVPRFLGCSTLFVEKPDDPAFAPVSVSARPLDDMVSERVDLMKIDAEGSEPLILEGMRGVLDRSPEIKIVSEFNQHTLRMAGVDPLSFIRRIEELGLKTSIVSKGGAIEPFDERKLMASPMSTLLLEKTQGGSFRDHPDRRLDASEVTEISQKAEAQKARGAETNKSLVELTETEKSPGGRYIPSVEATTVEQLSKAAGENALLQGQLDQVFADRVLGLQKNAFLQGQLSQAIASRLFQLEKTASQTRETMVGSLQTLENLLRDLNRRIDSLASGRASSDLVVAPVGEGLLLTKVLNNFLMYVEAADMSVTPYLVTHGYWEKCITDAFIARVKPGMTVVDVGANYGYYTLIAGGVVGTAGRVYSFEPNPRAFELLMKNIHVNWYGSVVRAHQLAVLDSKKQVELHALRHFQGSSSLFVPELVPEADPPPERRPVVEAVPLDEIIQERVDLMKIDAEGSEPLIFEGMRGIIARSPNLTILMEFNIPMIRKSVDPQNFLRRIREFGFSMQWITPWDTLEPFEEEKAMQFPMFNLLLERN